MTDFLSFVKENTSVKAEDDAFLSFVKEPIVESQPQEDFLSFVKEDSAKPPEGKISSLISRGKEFLKKKFPDISLPKNEFTPEYKESFEERTVGEKEISKQFLAANKAIEEMPPPPDTLYAFATMARSSGIPISKEYFDNYKKEFKGKYGKEPIDWPYKLTGKVTQLAAIQTALGATPIPAELQKIVEPMMYTKKGAIMGGMIFGGALNAIKYGTGGFIDELSSVLAKEKKMSFDIAKTTTKEAAFGTTLGMIHAIYDIPSKVILSGLNRVTWVALEDKIKKGVMDNETFKKALFAFGVGAISEGVGAKEYQRQFDLTGMSRLIHAQGVVNDYMQQRNEAISTGEEFVPSEEQVKIGKVFVKEKFGEKISADKIKEILTVLKNDPQAKEVTKALIIKELPEAIFELPVDKQNTVLKDFADNFIKGDMEIKSSIDKAIENIPIKQSPELLNELEPRLYDLYAIPDKKYPENGRVTVFTQEELDPNAQALKITGTKKDLTAIDINRSNLLSTLNKIGVNKVSQSDLEPSSRTPIKNINIPSSKIHGPALSEQEQLDPRLHTLGLEQELRSKYPPQSPEFTGQEIVDPNLFKAEKRIIPINYPQRYVGPTRIKTESAQEALLSEPSKAMRYEQLAKNLDFEKAEKIGQVQIDQLPQEKINKTKEPSSFLKSFKEIRKLASPMSFLSEADKDILVGTVGERNFKKEKAFIMMQKQIEDFDKKTNIDRRSFLLKMETGQYDKIEGADKKYADELQSIAKDQLERMIKLKPGTVGIKDYVSRLDKKLFGDDSSVSTRVSNKPMGGLGEYFGKRYYGLVEDKIAAYEKSGVKKEVDTNPYRATLIKEYSIQEREMAHELYSKYNPLKKMGYYKSNEIPERFKEVKDARWLFQDYTESKNRFVSPDKRLYAEEGLADVINNYLGSSVFNSSEILSNIKTASKTITAANLAFSAYGFLRDGINAFGNQLGEGIQDTFSGHITKGIKEIITSPAAEPIKMLKGGITWNKFTKGDPEASALVENFFTKGGQLGNSPSFKETFKLMKENFKNEGKIKGAWKNLPYFFELSSKAYYRYAIPALQLGSFNDRYAQEIKLAGGKIPDTQVGRELYNNLKNLHGNINWSGSEFINKSYKDIIELWVRTLGYNMRELSIVTNSGLDSVKFINDMMKGESPRITKAMYTLLGIVAGSALAKGAYQYYHTEKWPESILDYIAPRNGQKDNNGQEVRVNLPDITKDFVNFYNRPGKTIMAKANPIASIAIKTLTNENHYGDMIRNPQDPYTEQLLDWGNFLASQMTVSFSVQNLMQEKKEGYGVSKAETFMGISKNRDLTESKLTKKIYQAVKTQMKGDFKKLPEEVEIRGEKTKAREEIKSQTGDYPIFKKLVNEGKIKDIDKFIEGSFLTAPQRAFKLLAQEIRLELFEGMTPEEKKQYADLL